MQAKLQNRKIGERVIVVEFAVPAEFSFQPGEYMQVILGDDKNLKHYFSIASSPTEQGIVRIATRPSVSAFKTALQNMPLGTEVEIAGPWGDLLLPTDISKEIVFIAGGIGVTPFLSMLPFVIEKKLPYKISTLFFTTDHLFEKDLAEYMRALGGKFIATEEHVNAEFIKKELPNLNGLFFVAGPPGFVNEALNALSALKIPPAQIINESYSGY